MIFEILQSIIQEEQDYFRLHPKLQNYFNTNSVSFSTNNSRMLKQFLSIPDDFCFREFSKNVKELLSVEQKTVSNIILLKNLQAIPSLKRTKYI